jgi:hypothetical protein
VDGYALQPPCREERCELGANRLDLRELWHRREAASAGVR